MKAETVNQYIGAAVAVADQLEQLDTAGKAAMARFLAASQDLLQQAQSSLAPSATAPRGSSAIDAARTIGLLIEIQAAIVARVAPSKADQPRTKRGLTRITREQHAEDETRV